MKKNLKIMMVVILAVLAIPTISNAALQASPSTHYKYTDIVDNWVVRVRGMEAPGGVMGLSEENIGSDLVADTSNGIDVHQMKNTEFGAAALLAASSYGNDDITGGAITTTGNQTGVYLTAGQVEVPAAKYTGLQPADINTDRYMDIYETTEFKIGDAMRETRGWYGSRYYGSESLSTTYGVWQRVNYGLFGYWPTYATSGFATRAVVVIADGV